jgi:hypothetical protein
VCARRWRFQNGVHLAACPGTKVPMNSAKTETGFRFHASTSCT